MITLFEDLEILFIEAANQVFQGRSQTTRSAIYKATQKIWPDFGGDSFAAFTDANRLLGLMYGPEMQFYYKGHELSFGRHWLIAGQKELMQLCLLFAAAYCDSEKPKVEETIHNCNTNPGFDNP